MTRRRVELLWLALPIPARLAVFLFGAALAGFVVLAFLSGCATQPEGVQITVSEEKAAQCIAQGGCGLLSLAQILAMLQKRMTKALPKRSRRWTRRAAARELLRSRPCP